MLAVAPLLFGIVDVVLRLADVGSNQLTLIDFGVAFGVSTALCILDSRRLKEVGVEVQAILGILLVPVYLFLRSHRARQSLAIPLVWIGCFVVSIVAPVLATTATGVQLDMDLVEQQITDGIQQQTSTTVEVDCPDMGRVHPGDTFKCIATSATDTAVVDVTVQNKKGVFVWELRG